MITDHNYYSFFVISNPINIIYQRYFCEKVTYRNIS